MSTYPQGKLDLLPLDHSVEGTLPRNLIVLHITAGPTALSAINTFKASVAPNRVSVHFGIDRDGTVSLPVTALGQADARSSCVYLPGNN
jgi:hypothetical protein